MEKSSLDIVLHRWLIIFILNFCVVCHWLIAWTWFQRDRFTSYLSHHLLLIFFMLTIIKYFKVSSSQRVISVKIKHFIAESKPIKTQGKLRAKIRRCRGSNPGHPRDRRVYSPLYYNDFLILRFIYYIIIANLYYLQITINELSPKSKTTGFRTQILKAIFFFFFFLCIYLGILES